jgi:hypothetical protein
VALSALPWCAGTSGTCTRTPRLPHPEGQAPHQRSRLGATEVPPQRPVVALAEQLRPGIARRSPPQGMQSRSVSTCPRRYSRPHRTRNAPTGVVREASRKSARCRGRLHRADRRASPNVPAVPRMIGPKKASASSSRTKACTKAGARKWASDGTGGAGAGVVPVPSASSAPARATNILAGGNSPPPWPLWRGVHPSALRW